MKYFTTPIVIVDVETTGFGPTSEVIEIGAVCLDEYGRIRSEFGALIQNENELDGYAYKAMAINNITKEQLNNAASKSDIQTKFVDWWNAIPKDQGITAVAFNQRFDSRRLSEIGIYLPWGKCLMEMTKQVMVQQGLTPITQTGRRKGQVSLHEACQFLGLEYPENAHRALEDCRITAQVACKISRFWGTETAH